MNRGPRGVGMRRGAWCAAVLAAAAAAPAEEPPGPVEKAPDVVEVSPDGSTGFGSIRGAILAVAPGGRVLLRPGRYSESVLVDRPVTVEGKGLAKDVVVTAEGGPCIDLIRDALVLRRMTLTQPASASAEGAAVLVSGGSLVAEECDISSGAGAGVVVDGEGVAAVLRKCRIHHTGRYGVLAVRKGSVATEESEIATSILDGVLAWGGTVSMRGGRIAKTGKSALYSYEGASVTADRVDVLESGHGGVMVDGEGSRLVFRDGSVRDSKLTGILAFANGSAVVERTEVSGNGSGGAQCREDGMISLLACKVRKNKELGIWIYKGGTGRVEDCDILANEGNGVVAEGKSDVTVKKCRIRENAFSGVCLFDGAKGFVDGCTIIGNLFNGVEVRTDSEIVVQGCTAQKNVYYGVCARKGTKGSVEKCDLRGNRIGAIYVEEGASLKQKGNLEK